VGSQRSLELPIQVNGQFRKTIPHKEGEGSKREIRGEKKKKEGAMQGGKAKKGYNQT